MARFNLNGHDYTTGAHNGAAADLVAANALLDQLDAIISAWGAAHRANPSGFNSQGGEPIRNEVPQHGRHVVNAVAARLAQLDGDLTRMGASRHVRTAMGR